MLSDSESRQKLKELAEKYLKGHPDFQRIINIIDDESRPGLPVRGVLEDIRRHKDVEYTPEELDVIEELIYVYG